MTGMRSRLWPILTVLSVAATSTAYADAQKGRARVKDFEFDFEPAPGSASVAGLTICLLPPINDTRIERHTKNIDKAMRNLEPSEHARVLGFRYNANGKPLNRFLVRQPFEELIAAALTAELETLGVSVMASPAAEPPGDFRRQTLTELAGRFPGDKPDVIVGIEIEDFYFETRPGFSKLKMETFFVLDVTVFDTAANEVIWDGEVEAGDLEKKAMFMGRDAVDTRLNAAFRDLIEGLFRNNTELQVALAGGG